MRKLIIAILSLTPCYLFANTLSVDALLEAVRKSDVALTKIIHQKTQEEYLEDLSLPSSEILLEFKNEYGIATEAGKGNTSVLSAGASKDINATGTSISVEYANNKQIGRNEQTIQLRVEQSLYKNFFGSRVRGLGRALELEKKVLILGVAESYEDYVASIINRYLDWQLSFLNFKAAESLHADAITLQKNLARRRAKSIASSIDVDKAKLQTLSRQEALLREQSDFRSQTDALVTIAGIQESLIPSPEAPYQEKVLSFADDMKRLQQSGRSLELVRYQEQALIERVEYVGTEASPDLRLIAGYNHDNSTRFNVAANRGLALIGVNFLYPLGDSENDAKTREAIFKKDQAAFTRKEKEREIQVLVLSLKSQIEQKREEVAIGKDKLELSESLAKRERVRFNQGRVDFETMLSAQDTLANNQFSHLKQKVELAKLVVEWLRVTDNLITANALNKN